MAQVMDMAYDPETGTLESKGMTTMAKIMDSIVATNAKNTYIGYVCSVCCRMWRLCLFGMSRKHRLRKTVNCIVCHKQGHKRTGIRISDVPR